MYYVVNLYSGHAFLHIGGFNPGYIGVLACLLYLFYTLCMTVRLDVNFFCLTSTLISIYKHASKTKSKVCLYGVLKSLNAPLSVDHFQSSLFGGCNIKPVKL